jgi:hypothetical protein
MTGRKGRPLTVFVAGLQRLMALVRETESDTMEKATYPTAFWISEAWLQLT